MAPAYESRLYVFGLRDVGIDTGQFLGPQHLYLILTMLQHVAELLRKPLTMPIYGYKGVCRLYVRSTT